VKQGKKSRKRLEVPLLFPAHAYVALCTDGGESDNPNVIRMAQGQYIFLDCGKWLGVGKKLEMDVGVIWGRHVYLCHYDPDPPNTAPSQPQASAIPASGRLDEAFFKTMGKNIVVEKRASAFWAPDEDFEWDRIYVMSAD